MVLSILRVVVYRVDSEVGEYALIILDARTAATDSSEAIRANVVFAGVRVLGRVVVLISKWN